ncbi:acylphosphatase [Candidatus Parcubacteria bacterium]|nr:MAG: acylphosphatase [Candidatus Parcubacteria bacterium]
MIKRLLVRLTGEVQGIGLRYSARRRAQELGLSGFIRNEPDGSVYLEAEGKYGDILSFLKWLGVESPAGVVGLNDLVVSDELKNFRGFSVE